MLKPNIVARRRTASVQCIKEIEIPHMGHKQSELKSQNPNRNKQRRTNNQKGPRNNNQNLYMVVPYHQGLSERVKKTCSKYGVQVHFKGGQTIKSLLMAPEDNDPINSKSGVIYRYQCNE